MDIVPQGKHAQSHHSGSPPDLPPAAASTPPNPRGQLQKVLLKFIKFTYSLFTKKEVWLYAQN